MNKPTLLGTNHTWEPHSSDWQRQRARGTIRPLDYARPSDAPKPWDGQDIAIKATCFMIVVLFGFVWASFA